MTNEPEKPTGLDYLQAIARIPILKEELKRLRALVATYERREQERAEEAWAAFHAVYVDCFGEDSDMKCTPLSRQLQRARRSKGGE